MTTTKYIVFAFLLFLASTSSFAQRVTIEGRIMNKTGKLPLYGAHVRLLHESDTSLTYLTATDTAGHFAFTDPRRGNYTLEATFLGFEKYKKPVTVARLSINLGAIVMTESAIPLQEVLIEDRSPRAIQKGDTTEYTAQAFKVNKDANAEDLVTKMPGVTVENGTVKAQGEDVQQVLVDGKQFFGNDPTVALRNLPAEVIDKIQVFDKMSDQAQFTGFDDGRSVKTMNIVTRGDRRQGQFGRFNAGYGTEERYVTSGNFNNFNSDMRLSIIGLSNNVNQQNFSSQDLLGVMSGGSNQRGGPGGGGQFGGGRRGGGPGGGGGMMMGGGNANNFFVGQQSGTSTVHSLGLNYSDSLASNLFTSGSYFFNLTNNQNPQRSERQYTFSEDSSSYYNELSDAEKKNYNHRFNARVEYTIDTSNSIILAPQISFQDNKSTSFVGGINSISPTQILSETDYENKTVTNGFSSDNRLTYRRRFSTPGRTVSLDFGFGKNRRESEGEIFSRNLYYTGMGVRSDTIDQHSTASTNGYSLSSNIAYTEPISATTQIQVNYSPSYSNNVSEKRTYNFDAASSGYTILDNDLSNSYENSYTTHNAGITFRYRLESFNLSIGTSYQIAGLQSDQSFPYVSTLSKTFYTVLPNLMLNYELPQRNGLRVFYRTSTNSPSISQLQNVLDNSNPLFLATGNPDLKQTYSHSFMTRLSLSNTERVQSIMLFAMFNITQDYIANSTFYAQNDTVLPDGIALSRGSQLTRPVNIDGYWNARTFATYGLPLEFLRSNLNINAGVSYTRTPGLLNGEETRTNTYALSPGIVLGSNISEDLDFTLSYTANFNNSKNSLQSDLDNTYFTHTASLRLNWIFWNGFVLRNDLTNSMYNGLTGDLDQNIWLCNISIGKKLFENERGELTLTAADIFNQNKSINRTVTETYIEDTQTYPLQRYFLLTFTYNLRQFGQ